jgi:hypothetical protein
MTHQLQYVQRSRKPGTKLPPNTKCCTRPGKWGNNHRVGEIWQGAPLTLAGCVHLYKLELENDLIRGRGPRFLSELAGYDFLACSCKPGEPCHVQNVLIPLVNMYLAEIET